MAVKITVRSNIDEIRRLDRIAAGIPDAIEAGVKAVMKDVSDIADTRAGKIYRRTIPKQKMRKATRERLHGKKSRKKLRPQWERSGDLFEGIDPSLIEYPSQREANLEVRGRAAKYARRRHELGESWTPKNPAGGVIRHNPFFKEAVKISKPKIQPVFESAFKAKLGI